MARFDIQLLGDKELQRMLADMTEKLERKVLVGAFRKVGRQVQQDAERRVPLRQVRLQVGLEKRRIRQLQRVAQKFARLRNNLTLKPLRRRKHRIGYMVVTGTRQQLGIQGTYYYPAHVELGHAGPHGSARRTRPHPYLRPAIKNEALLGMLTSEIRAGIERHAADPPGSGGTRPA